MTPQRLSQKVQIGLDLSVTESQSCLEAMLSGAWSTLETVTFLDALRTKGESVSEIVGFAQGLQRHMIPVTEVTAIDLCGTGGGPAGRYNVSTASAFVLATAGVQVAKHGNRGSRQPNGSFDFLEALGVPILTDPAKLRAIFQKTGLCFLYARAHHPAVATVAEARKVLGGRSIFNLIGPLCNPSNPNRQIIGVSDSVLGPKIAQAAQALGKEHVIVVSGDHGYDEITPFGHNQTWDMRVNAAIVHDVYTPAQDMQCGPESLCMANLAQSVSETRAAFSGQDTAISRYIALNAGLGFYCAAHVETHTAGIALAKTVLASGEVMSFLNQYQSLG